jgi:hypothetical protein
MTHEVFISFKSEDIDFAEKICDDLGSKGFKCWISSRGIRGGQAHQEAITNALLDASVLVLVFSSAADKSDEIIKELSIASQYKKHVIPVRIEDFLPAKGSKFIYELASRQYIDLFKNWEREIEHLANDIRFLITGPSVDIQGDPERKLPPHNTEIADVNYSNFALLVRQAIKEDGIIGTTEQKYFEEEAIKTGLSIERARQIIKEEILNSSQMPIGDSEQSFLQVITEVLEDGRISSTERKLLESRAKALGISDLRAQFLLEQEMEKPAQERITKIDIDSIQGSKLPISEIIERDHISEKASVSSINHPVNQHLDDDDLLKHFDNTPEFKLLRASWSDETLEAFCKLARAVNAAGLDWWRVGKVTVKFGRKNPGSERAIGVVGVIRGRRTRTVSLLRSVSGIVKLHREPLTLALASKLEIAIAAESFEEWKLHENERPGLWPDQLLGEDEDESSISDTYEAQDEDAQIGGQLNEIPRNNVSESNHETTNANISWPSVGHDFLKAIKQNLDVSLLPFTPVEIADNESIEDTNQVFWQINDKHLISVWFDAKSRRSGKVTVLWGFYSSYEKRDPVFRKACDDICAIPNSLNENGYFSLNNYVYEFFSDGYLGFETSDRPTFEQMSDALYIKHITEQLIEFSLKIWPAIS